MKEITAPKKEPKVLSEPRRNTIIRESYDWSQGDKNTGLHQDIAWYVLIKHPEWRSAFSDNREIRENRSLLRGVTARVRGSRHKEVDGYVIPRNHAIVANLFQIATGEHSSSLMDVCGRIVINTLSRDRAYMHGRPEKSKTRPLIGHGRKFQSFFCDYFILNLEYPGDPLWVEMIQDVRKYLHSAKLDGQVKEAIRDLIEKHNEWCDKGWSTPKIDAKRLKYLK